MVNISVVLHMPMMLFYCPVWLSNCKKTLDICYGVGMDLNVVFNAKKSALFEVGKVYEEAIDCFCIG